MPERNSMEKKDVVTDKSAGTSKLVYNGEKVERTSTLQEQRICYKE